MSVILHAWLAACAPTRDSGADAVKDSPDAPRSAADSAFADSAFADSVLRAAEDMGASFEVRPSDNAAPVRDANEIRLTLQAYAVGTYIGDVLAARDSVLHRWPDRAREPLAVWIQPVAADLHEAVRTAFTPWLSAGVPLDFRFVEDSARAEVLVTWVARYESRTSGRTRWTHDQHGWITAASIELALAQPDGTPLDARGVGAIARHEVGHLLGLDHTADQTSIMAANVRVDALSEADRQTVRLLYLLPPGRLRAP